jgi:hypothetical protein
VTTPTATATPTAGKWTPTEDVYARTLERENRLRAMVARAHERHAEANGYDAALNEILRLGLGKDAEGNPIKISKRTRAQILRTYVQSTQKAAGVGRALDEDAVARPAPQITINLAAPRLREASEPPAKAADVEVKSTSPLPLPPPAANGHAKEGT